MRELLLILRIGQSAASRSKKMAESALWMGWGNYASVDLAPTHESNEDVFREARRKGFRTSVPAD
jgi:hypothetical protein